MEESMSIIQQRYLRRSLWLIVIGAVIISAGPVAAAVPAAYPAATPLNLLVTSDSDLSITTCAGAPNDCSLRGAVQVANAAGAGTSSVTIHFSPTVSSIILNSTLTLIYTGTHIIGNGAEATALYVGGNFPGVWLAANGIEIAELRFDGTGYPGGANQHGVFINSMSSDNFIHDNAFSDLDGSGVYVQSTVGGNWIYGNYVGVQTVSSVPLAACPYRNSGAGIRIANSPNNSIYNNTIGCNNGDGVAISGADATGNWLYNNFIGVTALGARVPNILAGVVVWAGAHHNQVGTASAGNVIGGNGTYGVYLSDLDTNHNLIQRNAIGISGTLNISNTVDGILVRANAQSNNIFTNTIAFNAGYGAVFTGPETRFNSMQGNTVWGNALGGVVIDATPGYNQLLSNYVGVQTTGGAPVAGCAVRSNGAGIRLVDSSYNDILNNTIGCHNSDGVAISGSSATDNWLTSNFIGVTALNARVPNTLAGVALWGGAHANQIGRETGGNVIGGNGTYGVYLGGTGTNNNRVQRNSIGISGTINISNTADGVSVWWNASYNQILTNTLANNNGYGAAFTRGAQFNAMEANTVRANRLGGVVIDNGASYNRLGANGTLTTTGNLIGGHATAAGVRISGAATQGNELYHNLIGVEASGQHADPNYRGLWLEEGTHHNTIGAPEGRNIIAGNTLTGLAIISGAHDNSVKNNDIGLNRSFLAGALFQSLPNGGDGLAIQEAYTNTIGATGGGPGANYIYYNVLAGIYLAGGSQANVIGGNTIRANHEHGILLYGLGTASNTISRTQLIANGLDGIGERGSATNNVWTEVAMWGNGGLGIDQNAEDNAQNVVNAPDITFDSINRATGVVQGSTAPTVGTTRVELYRVSPDPSGFGEGREFVGRATANVAGLWTITDATPDKSSGCYTAIVVTAAGVGSPFRSSEFSVNTCRVFLPLVRR
jgi:parallel beta-helix repeat protein